MSVRGAFAPKELPGLKHGTSTEKDKVMNNANFGCNCRNNAHNYFFTPVFDEELSYLKCHPNVFYPEISEFLSTERLEK